MLVFVDHHYFLWIVLFVILVGLDYLGFYFISSPVFSCAIRYNLLILFIFLCSCLVHSCLFPVVIVLIFHSSATAYLSHKLLVWHQWHIVASIWSASCSSYSLCSLCSLCTLCLSSNGFTSMFCDVSMFLVLLFLNKSFSYFFESLVFVGIPLNVFFMLYSFQF